MDVVKENGKHEIIDLPPEDIAKWKSLVKPMWNEWAEKMEKKGFPGKETVKFIERFGTALEEER